MKQSFYKSSHLTPQQLGDLIKKDNQTSGIHFLVMYSLFISAGSTLVFAWEKSGWITTLAFILFAASIPALFACEHESVHQTAFKNRSFNYWAALLAGVSYGYIPTIFRDLHFTHHQYTHQPGLDPEISFAGRPIPSIISNLPNYLSWVTGFPLVIFRMLSLIIGALGMPRPIQQLIFPFVKPEHRLKIFLESWLTLLIHGSIVYFAITLSWLWGE
ncbi:MAG: fatty acid desaturase [Aureispira sp.]